MAEHMSVADSASELDSDASSVDAGPVNVRGPSSREGLQKRIDSLQQENRVLKIELETMKMRVKSLQEENKELRKNSVMIQARAEQEEEMISNTLLKKIQSLKKEKEMLAMKYEQEEECLTNDLSRKLGQLRQEKVELEQTLEREQEQQVNKLMRKIKRLEADITNKQQSLEQLRRDKVDLENALEQEQEGLVNRLWKRMDKLEAEKRQLQEKLDQPVSEPASPRDMRNGDTVRNLTQHIGALKSEVTRLRQNLLSAHHQHETTMAALHSEERQIREENVRLQQRLQIEMERREALCRHLSESESSLEMDDERHFNEMSKHHDALHERSTSTSSLRARTVSSPIPYDMPPSRPPRTQSPAGFGPYSPSHTLMCDRCGTTVYHSSPQHVLSASPPAASHLHYSQQPSAAQPMTRSRDSSLSGSSSVSGAPPSLPPGILSSTVAPQSSMTSSGNKGGADSKFVKPAVPGDKAGVRAASPLATFQHGTLQAPKSPKQPHSPHYQ